ncbi:predicted protein [Haematococcus lacustris]|uniref:PNPLA domain-containing protein n=1 Tax=Haematococcus lacustris TaxID=44745 RepID=A0A699ZXA5_HAELA|nr:predicted protein [Haematococcus lacustris]
MERHLPDNAHQLCSGGLFVGISELLPYPRHVQVSQFPSRAALIDALLTSCHLPRYSSPAWTLTYNGRPTVDGGFTAIVPSLPPSTGCHTVKASSAADHRSAASDLSKSCNRPGSWSQHDQPSPGLDNLPA